MEELIEKIVKEKMLQDIDGAMFYAYRHRNRQAVSKLVSDVKELIAYHGLSVSEAKGFLEYMKIIVDSAGSLQIQK